MDLVDGEHVALRLDGRLDDGVIGAPHQKRRAHE
jgi:hypothetical protein